MSMTTPADGPRRDLPATAGRILLIGLDGATFDILRPMMDAGRMPRLAELVRTGTAGVLQSTTPPITPAAWTTFMTGKGPGRHGIIDFERYDVAANRLAFNSTYQIREPTIWSILSGRGFRVGSIHLPMCYPPPRVNGFVVSGFETPGIDAEFTWPVDLRAEILRRWPDYSYRSSWKRKALGGDALLQRNLDFVNRSFAQGLELTTFCGERYGWDVLMVLFKLVDNLQHKAWKYLDPRTCGRWPRRAEMAAACFSALDETIGGLVDYAREREAAIVIMSDHGHGSLDGKAQPNLLLEQWGYLAVRSSVTRAAQRVGKSIDRTLGRTKKRFDANEGIERDLALDWSRTRACVVHAGMCGFLYISLKGRQPGGLVEPGDYERVRDDLQQRFRDATCTDPAGERIRVFAEVHRPEELYDCRREDQPWMPDLMLVPHPGLAVVRKIRGRRPVQWSSARRLEGTHRVEGILIANGPGIRRGGSIEGRIADIAPTVLAALGVRVPDDMEGRVLTDLFESPPAVEYAPAGSADASETAESPDATRRDEDVYSEREKEALVRRLSDLGYLE